MATWDDVVGLVQIMNGSAAADNVLTLELNGNGPSRKQQLVVSLEVSQEGVKLVKLQSPFGTIDSQNTADYLVSIFRDFGSNVFGGLGFVSDDSGDSGTITLTSTIPLALLDLSDPRPFFSYLLLFAKLADYYEQQIFGPDAPNMF
jgi:hypothetical protein